MNAARSAALAALLLAPVAAQSARWTLVGADADVHVIVASAGRDRATRTPLLLRGPRAFAATDAGDGGSVVVTFAADALGKPESLRLDVPRGADVHLAVAAAGKAPRRELDVDGGGWTEPPGANARVTGDAAQRDYRVEACWNAPPGGGDGDAVGLVARWSGAGDHYALVREADGAVRLERRTGGHTLLLASAPHGPRGWPLRLAFELDGFRLRGFVGDHAQVDVLDGALTGGQLGWCWRGGARPPLAAITVGPPAPPRTSVALVREAGGAATLHVAGPMPPGHLAVLELRLDRPGPLVPATGSGLEPWLLHRPIGPHVMFTDWASSLGAGTFAEVPPRGQLECRVRWPDLPALRGQVALARLVFVTPDGTVAAGVSPAAPLRL